MTTDQSTFAKIGIVTVSDRASRGEYEDLGGPAISQRIIANSNITLGTCDTGYCR